MLRRASSRAARAVAKGLLVAGGLLWLTLGCASRTFELCSPDSLEFQRDVVEAVFGPSRALDREYEAAKREEDRLRREGRCPG